VQLRCSRHPGIGRRTFELRNPSRKAGDVPWNDEVGQLEAGDLPWNDEIGQLEAGDLPWNDEIGQLEAGDLPWNDEIRYSEAGDLPWNDEIVVSVSRHGGGINSEWVAAKHGGTKPGAARGAPETLLIGENDWAWVGVSAVRRGAASAK